MTGNNTQRDENRNTVSMEPPARSSPTAEEHSHSSLAGSTDDDTHNDNHDENVDDLTTATRKRLRMIMEPQAYSDDDNDSNSNSVDNSNQVTDRNNDDDDEIVSSDDESLNDLQYETMKLVQERGMIFVKQSQKVAKVVQKQYEKIECCYEKYFRLRNTLRKIRKKKKKKKGE
jgi:hypothetical protein